MLLSIDFQSLHEILRNLYNEMMPLCSQMTGVAKGLAGLGALFYVAAKVWQALARAEPIDVYPLLRPFAIGLCIMFFPTFVLSTINTVLSPIVTGTHSILESQTFDMNAYQQKKDRLEYEAYMKNPETAYLVNNEEFDKQIDALGWGVKDMAVMAGMHAKRLAFNAKKSFRELFREIVELIFHAAALVIDVLRTFFLIVLSILGPIAFAISVYDGFQATLTQWLTRYISVYMWLPVSDLFSSILARIQISMLDKDIQEMETSGFIPDSTDAVYIIFMIIGIIGYFTIPSVANWIIQSGGMGNLGKQVNAQTQRAGKMSASGGKAAAGATGSAVGNIAGRLMGR